LLTLRAAERLRSADLVLYDKLVPIDLLDEFIREEAERVCVADLGYCHGQPGQQVSVHEKMIAAARQGKRVVRLKGGDPSLFGRAAEEASALRQADIPYEIVPGVTAAIGAAAFAGIPLTHRAHASAVVFVTGHETPDKPETMLDWALLARFPGTLVVYMGMSRLAAIAQLLIGHGKDPHTPAAVVQWASTGDQQTIEAPLAELPERVKQAGVCAPALIFIGAVVGLRQHLKWFEERPLFGQRILVTRPRHQAGDLVHRLIDLGAVPQVLPAVAILPPADWGPVDRAITQLESYAWLVFTSANGVHAFLGRLRQQGRDLRALGPVRLAAIGPRTADALRQYHLEPDLVPARFQSEDLAAALKDKVLPEEKVLLARADRGRELLREELARVCVVEQLAVYSQVDSIDPASRVLDNLRRGEIDYITLTSSNIARSLIEQLDVPCRARLESGAVGLVSISPVTSGDIRRLGLPVAAEASEATAEGVVEALIKLVRSRREL
jgi:uroporphyrinogen III methyltransferase/synthase